MNFPYLLKVKIDSIETLVLKNETGVSIYFFPTTAITSIAAFSAAIL